MLAYVADHRPPAPTLSPRTLMLVLVGHAALLAVVMTARGDLKLPRQFNPTDVIFIEPVKPPPPKPQPQREPVRSAADRPISLVPLPIPNPIPLDPRPLPDVLSTPDVGQGTLLPTPLPLPPTPAVLRKAPRFATPAGDVRPPYPPAKLRLGEEASLRLALEIDARGRVVAVEPVAAADPVFLDAARRHILKRWRYRPATEGGQPVSSRIIVNLSFRIDE